MLLPALEKADFAASEMRVEAAEKAEMREEATDARDPNVLLPSPEGTRPRAELPSSLERQDAVKRRAKVRPAVLASCGSAEEASTATVPAETSLARARMTPDSI